jgi:hypothetical protein
MRPFSFVDADTETVYWLMAVKAPMVSVVSGGALPDSGASMC